jgi:hypothetical protein
MPALPALPVLALPVLALSVAVAALTVVPAGPARAQGAIAFGPAVNYPTGSTVGPGPGAETTVTGDVNGDGKADVVMTDPFGSGPIVALGRGDGSFGPPIHITGAPGVGAIAIGDFNGDGHLDLAGRDGYEVVVILGNGDGTFRVTTRTPLLENAQQAIAVFDTNGDGKLDIVTPTPTGIQTLLGKGDGTFSVGPASTLLGLLSDLSRARLDGDAVPDLVAVDATPLLQRVVALRGNGDGSFTQTGTGPVGYGPEGVSAGDLNGDGYDDVVSVDSFSLANSLPTFSITVLLSDGHGGFGPPTHYPVASGPVSGVIADFNRDGHLDVAVSAVAANAVTVYAGDGAGHLAVAGQLPVTPLPQSPAVADFNHDGKPDLAVPGPGNLSILLNQS